MIPGVCVHPSWSDTIYREHGRILDAVEQVGATVTRGASVYDGPWISACHARGLKVIVGANTAIPDDVWGLQFAGLHAGYPGTIIAVEGLNEPDLYADSYTLVPWPVYTHSHQTALRAQVTGVPLLAPSIGHVENYRNAGYLAGLCDAANVHSYARAAAKDIADVYDAARALAGQSEVWVTETDDVEQHQAAEVACRYQLCAPAKRHSLLWWKWWQQDWPEEDKYGLFRVSRSGALILRP